MGYSADGGAFCQCVFCFFVWLEVTHCAPTFRRVSVLCFDFSSLWGGQREGQRCVVRRKAPSALPLGPSLSFRLEEAWCHISEIYFNAIVCCVRDGVRFMNGFYQTPGMLINTLFLQNKASHGAEVCTECRNAAICPVFFMFTCLCIG